MPRPTAFPWSKTLSSVQSVHVSWIIAYDDEALGTLYVAEKKSIEWDSENRLLRCYLFVDEGEEGDFQIQVRFTSSGGTLKYDTDDAVEQLPLEVFEREGALVLLYLGRTESVTIRIRSTSK